MLAFLAIPIKHHSLNLENGSRNGFLVCQGIIQ